MVTSLHLMLVSALQHTHTALLHLSALPTIHSYQSRVVAGGRLSKSVVSTDILCVRLSAMQEHVMLPEFLAHFANNTLFLAGQEYTPPPNQK